MRKTSDIIWQDTQHQELFGIIEQINELEDSVDLFDRLIKHTDAHFLLEETYMEESDYPLIDKHKEEHAEFKKQLNNYIELNPVYDAEFRDKMSSFINKWLEEHVFGIDKELEKHLLGSNLK